MTEAEKTKAGAASAPARGAPAGAASGRDSERIALAARHFFTLVDAACRHGGIDCGRRKPVADVAAEALASKLGAGLADAEAALCDAGARWARNGARGWEREAWRRAATGWPKASPQPRCFSVKAIAAAAARRAMKEIP